METQVWPPVISKTSQVGNRQFLTINQVEMILKYAWKIGRVDGCPHPVKIINFFQVIFIVCWWWRGAQPLLALKTIFSSHICWWWYCFCCCVGGSIENSANMWPKKSSDCPHHRAMKTTWIHHWVVAPLRIIMSVQLNFNISHFFHVASASQFHALWLKRCGLNSEFGSKTEMTL